MCPAVEVVAKRLLNPMLWRFEFEDVALRTFRLILALDGHKVFTLNCRIMRDVQFDTNRVIAYLHLLGIDGEGTDKISAQLFARPHRVFELRAGYSKNPRRVAYRLIFLLIAGYIVV